MAQTVTVELPDSVYERLLRAAELLGKPTDEVVADSLNYTLSPVLDEIPARYQADVIPLLSMGESELRREWSQTFSARAWQEYETLLNRKKERDLTPEEARRLDALRRKADVLTLRRSYAAVLLKRRGHALPSLQEGGRVH